jgi:hypothetical protein
LELKRSMQVTNRSHRAQKEVTFDARELTNLAIYDRTVDALENSFSFRKRFRSVCGSSLRQP